MRRAASGFTLIELVTIMLILGILAVVAIPRMDTTGYRVQEFHDQCLSALRHAQKTATSHRRPVCVSFPDARTLQLDIDTNRNGVCDTALPIPGRVGNQVVSSDAVNAVFNPLPTAFDFSPDGTSPGRSLFITGAATIVVEGATGYVQ